MKTQHKTQNNLSGKVRAKVVDLLNQHLADAIDLGLQALKGPSFIALHELFDKVAAEVNEFTDEIAERLVALGGIAHGTLQVVSKSSRLTGYPLKAVLGKQHVAVLSGALARFGTSAREAIDAAAELKDADTADLFTEVSRGTDKLLWMVEAHQQATD